MVLAYAIMSNHFHIFIYVPEPSALEDDEILRRINALYREASLARVLGEWRRLKDEGTDLLKRACPTKKFVSRFREYRTSLLVVLALKKVCPTGLKTTVVMKI